MKIANLILTSQNGGAEQVFIDYSKVLKKLGHEVLAVVKTDAPYINKLEELEINVRKISNKFGYYDIFAINNLAKILREEKIDVVIAHIGKAMMIAHYAIKLFSNRAITLFAVNHSANVKRSLKADYIFSTNNNIFYRTIDSGRTASNSFVVANAIDLKDAIIPSKSENFIRKNEIIIGALGRFDRTKGFDDLIKSISILKKNSSKKYTLKLAGAGYFEDELKNLVRKLNLENEVNFVGWIENKKEFFQSFDIFCLPSKNEPFGLVLLEAMKYAKPIVTTDADGPKEILLNNIDAIFVQLNSGNKIENQLAASFERIVEDEDLRNKIILNSSQKVFKKYSLESLEANLNEFFKTVE